MYVSWKLTVMPLFNQVHLSVEQLPIASQLWSFLHHQHYLEEFSCYCDGWNVTYLSPPRIPGSVLAMQILCKTIQAIMMCLRLNSLHSVFLYNILHRPFNIPYACSVATLAEQILLLQCTSLGSLVLWMNGFVDYDCFWKAESPTIVIGILPWTPRPSAALWKHFVFLDIGVKFSAF